jgi:hypothetical protein
MGVISWHALSLFDMFFGMSSLPVCFYSDLVPYGGSLASIVDQTYPSSMLLFRSSHVHIDRFSSKYGSMDKVKRHVINQDWCVKKDGNVDKNLDLTLEDLKNIFSQSS